jgi:hypothetical protein
MSILLTYGISTAPSPLQVSGDGTPQTGIISVQVTNPNKNYCREIDISIPSGKTASDIYSGIPTASVNSNHWKLSAVVNTSDSNSFTFQCVDPNYYQISYPLTFTINGLVNDVAGTAVPMLYEYSSSTPGNWALQTYSFNITKVTAMSYINNFISLTPSNKTVPTSEFSNGAPIQLNWEGDCTNYQLYIKDKTTPIYSGPATTYTLTSGVATDTTFTLVGKTSTNSYIDLTLTVTVINPDLRPNSVVTRTLNVSDATTLNNMNVNGTSTLANANVNTLSVSGNTNVGSITASNATVGGQLVAGSAVINGQLSTVNTTINGQLTANAAVSVIGNRQSISTNNTYIAPTDGFLTGYVESSPNNQQKCRTIIYGSTEGNTVTATGGTYVSFLVWDLSDSTVWRGGLQNSFCLPVRKGAQFTSYTYNDPYNETNAPVTFFWIPLGTGNVSAPILVGDAPTYNDQPAIPFTK